LASKASLACATGANWLAAIAKAARQRFIGDMLQITEQQAVAGLGSRWPTATPARRPSRDSPIRFKSYKELQISALGRKCVRIPAPNLAQKPLQEKGFPHYAMH
jgi:hypothetical protein